MPGLLTYGNVQHLSLFTKNLMQLLYNGSACRVPMVNLISRQFVFLVRLQTLLLYPIDIYKVLFLKLSLRNCSHCYCIPFQEVTLENILRDSLSKRVKINNATGLMLSCWVSWHLI